MSARLILSPTLGPEEALARSKAFLDEIMGEDDPNGRAIFLQAILEEFCDAVDAAGGLKSI